jgi:hypothetical protein
MGTRTMGVAGMLAVLLLLGMLQAAPSDNPAPIPDKLARAKLDAARTTYQVMWKNNKEGLVPAVELAYRWSRRWLEAELDVSALKPDHISAYQAHLDRMRDLARMTHDRFENRVNTIDEVSASDFYRLEAQIWLEQAKNR